MRYKNLILVNVFSHQTLAVQYESNIIFLDTMPKSLIIRNLSSSQLPIWEPYRNVIMSLRDRSDILGKYYIFDYDRILKTENNLCINRMTKKPTTAQFSSSNNERNIE